MTCNNKGFQIVINRRKIRYMRRLISISVILALGAVGCHSQSRHKNSFPGQKILNTMSIESPAFKNGVAIPAKYTCSGQGINPPLTISNIPAGAKSLAFILDDPDAPMGTFTHWIIWNIPPATTRIDENSVPSRAVQGKNSAGQNKYFPPCPPSGVHHYHFKIFALDTILSLSQDAHVKELQNAMNSHIIATAELIGIYRK